MVPLCTGSTKHHQQLGHSETEKTFPFPFPAGWRNIKEQVRCLGCRSAGASPLLSFSPEFTVVYGVRPVPQQVSAPLWRKVASSPAPRDPCALPGCTTPSVGNVGRWWEGKGKGAEGGGCPPSHPRSASMQQIPAGWAHVRALSAG